MFVCVQTAYFRQHGCTTKEAHAKYNSRAASLYREKLAGLAATAQKKYGTQVHGVTYIGGGGVGNPLPVLVVLWQIVLVTLYQYL